MPGFDQAQVLALAALASSDGGQDPVDAAIRSRFAAWRSRHLELVQLHAVRPGDERCRRHGGNRAAATMTDRQGRLAVVVRCRESPPAAKAEWSKKLQAKGFRVLAVALGPPDALSWPA